MAEMAEWSSHDEWSIQKTRRGQRDKSNDQRTLSDSKDIKMDGPPAEEEQERISNESVGPERKQAKVDLRNLVGKPIILANKKPTRGLLQLDMSKIIKPTAEQLNFNLSEELWPSIGGCHSNEITEEHNEVSSEWSKVVKTAPVVHVDTVTHDDDNDRHLETEERHEKKKKSKKKKAGDKRHEKPLTLELSSIIDALEHSKLKSKKSDSTPVQFTVGTGAPPTALSSKQTNPANPAPLRNALDSSAPMKMRGKERETPKKKKPSSLRKVIEKEKEERKVVNEEGKPIPVLVTTTQTIATPQTQTLHNRKFRNYCTHLVTDKINTSAESLLTDLVKFQDRVYSNEPLKFKSKRRYICGLREVKKHLTLKRLKCVIIPPNLQRIQSPGGIDEIVNDIIKLCNEQQVTVVFALSRRRLAYILKKKFNIGCVGIFSYAGAEEKYKRLMDQVKSATEQFRQKCRQLLKSQQEPSTNDSSKTQDNSLSQEQLATQMYYIDTVTTDIPSDDDISDTDDGINVSDWKEIFDDDDEEPISDQTTANDDKKFSWNLNAPEFYPNFT